jgi:hypothetical protein
MHIKSNNSQGHLIKQVCANNFAGMLVDQVETVPLNLNRIMPV